MKYIRNVIMSQSNVLSSASTIPPSDQDDEDFNEELSHVNDLFFGNVEFNVGAEHGHWTLLYI